MNPYQNIWGDPIIGKDCKIAAFVEIGKDVVIGDRVKIEAFAFICPGVTLEDDVFIGPHVCFTNDPHPPSDKWLKTLVRKGAAIGANATILPGLVIGEGALVGAGALVRENIPPGEVWTGVPAKFYKMRKDL